MQVKFRIKVDTSVPLVYSVRDMEGNEKTKYFSSFKELKRTGKYDDVVYLNCSYMKLKSLPKLPKNLEELNCSGNELKKLPKLPKTLTKLNIYGNNIKKIPKGIENLQIRGEFDQCLSNYKGYSYSVVGTFTSAASQSRRYGRSSGGGSHLQDPMLYGGNCDGGE